MIQALRASFLLTLLVSNAYSDSLTKLWQNRKTNSVQQQLLETVFPGQLSTTVPSQGASSHWNTSLFPKGGQWTQLHPSIIPLPSSENVQALLFTIALRKDPSQEPYSMATYVLQEGQSHAQLLSTGFAAKESLQLLPWPKQRAPFILLKSMMADDPPTASFVIYRSADVLQNNTAPCWTHKPTRDYIELGIATHVPNTQPYLVERRQIGKTMSKNNQGFPNQIEFNIYQWTGERFEEEPIVFDQWLKALPETTWQYKPILIEN